MSFKYKHPPDPPRTIGVIGATAIIVGFVIGVSVFVLPGALAGSAGPAVVLVYTGASLLGLLACVVGAAIGCAYPTSAASFVAVSDLLGEVWGFLLVWLIVGASAVGLGLLSHGLAEYLRTLVDIDGKIIAVASICAIAVANVWGARASSLLQGVLVLVFLGALALFVGAGLPRMQVSLLMPFAPNGWLPVMAAIIPAYFSYAGFFVIIELAGEVREPTRTIPRAMALSFFLVLMTYVLVSLVLVAIVPWHTLVDDGSPVISAARLVLPESLLAPLALTAVAAGASSINGILLGYSRDLRALAERGLIPWRMLLHWSPMPVSSAGVLPMALLAIAAALISNSVTVLATQAVLGILAVQVLLAVALLRLLRRATYKTARDGMQLYPPVAWFCAMALIFVSTGAIALVVAEQPLQLFLMSGFMCIGWLLYRRASALKLTKRIKLDKVSENCQKEQIVGKQN